MNFMMEYLVDLLLPDKVKYDDENETKTGVRLIDRLTDLCVIATG